MPTHNFSTESLLSVAGVHILLLFALLADIHCTLNMAYALFFVAQST